MCMAKSASDVAQTVLPGWSPVAKQALKPVPPAGGAPTIHALCKKYGIKGPARSADEGLKAASASSVEFEFIVMAPPVDASASGNTVVVVANGKVVAVQG